MPVERINSYASDEELIKVQETSFNFQFLQDLLSDDYYRRLKSIIKSDSPTVAIGKYDKNTNTVEDRVYREFPISYLIKALSMIIWDERITEKDADRISALGHLTDFDAFSEKYKARVEPVEIDGITYRIRFSWIIDYLLMKDSDHSLFLNGNRSINVPVDAFFYSIKQLFKK